MTHCTRFAPSPTGRLHLGHVLAARVAFSLARNSAAGLFLLRHEDIDGPRVREEFYLGIEQDLEWLELEWNGDALRQTTRSDVYEIALASLRAKGLAYPCFCTRREIQDEWARMATAPQGPEGLPYPGTCRKLTATEQQTKLNSGIPHAWRLDSRKAAEFSGPLTFRDLRFGEIPVAADLLGDVVLARKDIGSAYHLAVVVDDAFQKITHVTRGEDLLPSTHVHRLLQVLLGLPEPIYLHHPLMRDEAGKRLAKRDESRSIAALREKGMSAAEVLALTDEALRTVFTNQREKD
jgi:glutamyl-Q tRNA(Asp) synthetase